VMAVPETNGLPVPSQHWVLSLENGMVAVVGLVDGGNM
jgi:hypothetical protein